MLQFVTENIRFQQRDVLEALPSFDDDFFDLCVIDPPYGVVVQKFWMALKIPESRPKAGKTKNFIVQNKFRNVNI